MQVGNHERRWVEWDGVGSVGCVWETGRGRGTEDRRKKEEDARETDSQRQRKRDTGGVYPVLFVTVAVIHVAYEI